MAPLRFGLGWVRLAGCRCGFLDGGERRSHPSVSSSYINLKCHKPSCAFPPVPPFPRTRPDALPARRKHADLAAWVSINGHPVEIYSVEEKPGAKKTVGFIEARDGEAFSIHSRDDGGAAEHTVDWATEVHLDGKV